MIAPVGAYVNSLSVSADRWTTSRQRPRYREAESQSHQKRTVAMS